MTTTPMVIQEAVAETNGVPVPDYNTIVTEDETPVDNIFSERQMRLLTNALYDSWAGPGEGRPFLALANVGLFHIYDRPGIVPDVMVSLDVTTPENTLAKENRSYFIWKYGKPPDVVIEIVSNTEGGERSRKFREYAWMGIPYYVIYDPDAYIQTPPLRVYARVGKSYQEIGVGFIEEVGLGLQLWEGIFQDWKAVWLRWTDAEGNLLPTGSERAEQERMRAEQERMRAEQERMRAERAEQKAEQERVRAEQAAAAVAQERAQAEQSAARLARLQAKLRELGVEVSENGG